MAGNTILLRSSNGDFGRKDEAVAGAAGIKPGMLVKLNSTNQVVVHPTADGFAARKIVLEDALQGKTVSDAYASGDRVSFIHANPTSKLNLLCKHGSNYTVGTLLASAGDGTFQPVGAGTKQALAEVKTASNLTAAGAPALVEAELI